MAQAVLASLVDEARARGFPDVWLRVVPSNEAAIACYRRAGFLRATAEQERAFNERQPHAYVWMAIGGAARRH